MRRLLPILLLLLARNHVPLLLQPECADAACKTTTTTTTTTTTSTTTTTLAGALIKDLFERAAPLGDNWTTATNYDALTIYNSSDASCTQADCASGNENLSYWDANTFTAAASYACVQVIDGTMLGNKDAGACLQDPSTTDAVCCTANMAAAGDGWYMAKFDAGVYSDVIALTTGVNWVTGEAIAIARTGTTTYQCWRQTGGTTWTQLGTDQTVANSGSFSLSASSFNPAIYSWGATADTSAGVLDATEAFEADDQSTPLSGAACGSN